MLGSDSFTLHFIIFIYFCFIYLILDLRKELQVNKSMKMYCPCKLNKKMHFNKCLKNSNVYESRWT